MKKVLFIFSIGLLLQSCSKELKESNSTTDQLISLEIMQSEVEASLQEGNVFHWTESSDEFIYSAGMHSDSIFTIGYTISPDFDMEKNIQDVDIKSSSWKNAYNKVFETILPIEKKARRKKDLTSKDLLPFGEESFFPQVIVHLSDINTISALRKSPYVRYVEPIGFSFEDIYATKRSDSGCDDAPEYNINSNDYATISPSTKRPWNFLNHSIPRAWSASTGDNIRIAIIDTGASDDQDNLGSQFTSGLSTNRNIQKYSTHVSGSWWWASLDSPHDQCGHGTSMAGIAAGPRGTDGNAMGVAYKADLMTIRAVKDVIISSSSERKGTRDALYLVGNNSSTKIASMSIGTPFYSSTVADGIYFAYNKGKLLVAAAGTSLSWTSWYPVIFPATMAQTTAVTGLKETSTNQKCTTCHSGPQVDFTIIMERGSDNDRTSLSLASYSNQPKYTGGSSCATATVSGIAALVWANNPSASRSTILQKLKNASEFYPARDGQFGWGKINAAAAVSGS